MKKVLFILSLTLCLCAAHAQPIKKWQVTDLEKYMKDSSSKVLVINFWASFCKPCIAEIPSFIKITDAHKAEGVSLLLVSLDLPSFYPEKIARFAKQRGYKANIVWLNETDADYFCPKIDQSWSGSIPSTLILNTKTGYRKFIEDEIAASDFEREVKLALASE